MMKWDLFGVVLLSIVLRVLGSPSDGRHPIYNIAHMVNSIREVEQYLQRGANAIEADVTFTAHGLVDSTYHGYPCDCFRLCNRGENFVDYISYIRNITIPGSESYKENLTLLFLELKSSNLSPQTRYSAGKNLANDLLKYLWNGGDDMTPIDVLISIGHTYDKDIVRGLLDTLKKQNMEHLFEKIGFDVGLNDEPTAIENVWKHLGVKKNVWQGDGLTNCLAPFRSTSRLRRLLKMRKDTDSYMSKVYQWTVDYTLSFRRSLRLGVEAFITNFPERLNSVLYGPEARKHYRLANIDDNPWRPVPIYPTVISDLMTTKPMSSNVYGTAQEVMDSLINFLHDATNANLNRNIAVSDFLPMMNYITNIDRTEPASPDDEVICQSTLCILFELYSNHTTKRRFTLETECSKGNGTPGTEIERICASLKKLLFQ